MTSFPALTSKANGTQHDPWPHLRLPYLITGFGGWPTLDRVMVMPFFNNRFNPSPYRDFL